MTDNLLTVHEAAEILGLPKLSVYRLIKRGRLRALRVGRDLRLRSSDVARYRATRMGSR